MKRGRISLFITDADPMNEAASSYWTQGVTRKEELARDLATTWNEAPGPDIEEAAEATLSVNDRTDTPSQLYHVRDI